MTSSSLSPSDPRSSYHGIVIAVIGPPHSGKSVFLAELYRQMFNRQPSRVFLHRACPDGEGMWSNEANPAIVQQIRKKSAFSEEFVAITLQGIERLGRNTAHHIVLLDLGGKRTAENAEILRRSTHCIILSAQEEEISQWSAFAITEGCEILAVLQSQLVHCPDDSSTELDQTARSVLRTDAIPVQGRLVNLCRDLPTDCYQETIASLAEILLTN